jgi:DHA1 family tetracycline resistance protein-like MFS transporter
VKSGERVRVSRVLPLYLVVFAGFVGYSLMIAIFTPLLLRPDGGMLPRSDSIAQRTIALGVLLALYPLAQFVAAPVIGGLSDRFGRKPTLLVSLAASTGCYGLIAAAAQAQTFEPLMVACFLAGLAEANIAIAQSAVADVAPAAQRTRLFGYVYLSASKQFDSYTPSDCGGEGSWVGNVPTEAPFPAFGSLPSHQL